MAPCSLELVLVWESCWFSFSLPSRMSVCEMNGSFILKCLVKRKEARENALPQTTADLQSDEKIGSDKNTTA